MRKFLLIAMFTALPLVASAQDAALVFSALDSDGDGSVSVDEASLNELVSQGFAAADSNGDGLLSQDEFIAAFGNG
jgi:Ca2+-binding EF-hand superfamily protein